MGQGLGGGGGTDEASLFHGVSRVSDRFPKDFPRLSRDFSHHGSAGLFEQQERERERVCFGQRGKTVLKSGGGGTGTKWVWGPRLLVKCLVMSDRFEQSWWVVGRY